MDGTELDMCLDKTKVRVRVGIRIPKNTYSAELMTLNLVKKWVD